MAACAICNDLRTQLGRQPVIARQVSRRSSPLHVKFLGEAHSFVAAGAGYGGQVLRGNGGIRIKMLLDGVDAVTIRAHRRLPVSTSYRPSVNALRELLFHILVTFGTSRGYIEFED